MKPIKTFNIKGIYNYLLFISIFTAFMVLFSLFELIMLLTRGRPLTFLWGLTVNLFPTDFNTFASYPDKIRINNISGSVLFYEPSFGINLYSGLYNLVIWLLIAYILYLLLKIIRTTLNGNPFVMQNVIRLRIIGFIIMVAPSALHSISTFFVNHFIQNIKMENIKLSASDGGPTTVIGIFVGLIFIALQEVFRTGIKLKEENELTV
jgi:hypothetical protein